MIIKSHLTGKNELVDTIIHVGAHLAQELEDYLALNPEQILWIEADPDVFHRLEQKLREYRSHTKTKLYWLNALITDSDNQATTFYRYNNNGHSSSIYKSTELLRNTWSGLQESGEVLNLRSRRLDSVIASMNLQIGKNSILVVDTQGSELLALKGLGTNLRKFKYIEVEISKEEIYQDAALYPEVDNYLNQAGFERESDPVWHGDIIYKRNQLEDTLEISVRQALLFNDSVGRLKELSALLDFKGLRKSQLMQEIFVLSELGFKHNGYFVEFGASDGVLRSNTYMLEKYFSWTGILSEPAKTWHNALSNARSCHIDRRCVWKESGATLLFNEVGELSTIDHYSNSDFHAKTRAEGSRYSVDTISLLDLLDLYSAPKEIDYLSIDTEGSEFEILNAFDFNQYKIKVITCEHNYSPMRAKIEQLLLKNGYSRQYEMLSGFDDWYVLGS